MIRNIWLADDDEDDCEMLQFVLSELGEDMDVTCIRNGLDLLTRLKSNGTLPDLVLIDINMPLKNGISCLQEIKANLTTKHLPVIVWSTADNKVAIEQSYILGATLYIKKPDTFSDLKEIIRKVISMNLNDTADKDQFRM